MKLVVSLTAGLLCFLIFLGLTSAALTDEARSYYKMDEASGAVIDSVSGISATNYGSTAGVSGVIGTAYDFDGTNDFINLSRGYGVFRDGNFTMNFWVRGDGWYDNDYVINPTGEVDMSINVVSASRLRFEGVGNLAGKSALSTGTLQNNTWYMITAIQNSSGFNLFINGKLNSSSAGSPGILNAGKSFNSTLAVSGNSTGFFKGRIDEFALWNRSLTNSEVTDLYSTQLAGFQYPFSNFLTLNSMTYNSTVYETTRQKFVANITLSPGTTISSASFIYNNTSYSATHSSVGDDVIISRSIPIPANVGTKPEFYFTIVTNNGTVSTAKITQTVNTISIGFCNSTLTSPFLNFSFRNEVTLAKINASITATTFDYYLEEATTYKTYSFSNSTEYYNYSFCFTPPSEIVSIDMSFPYASTGYPQRTFNPFVQAYTNISTEYVLYLLSSTDGLYVTFQVINTAEQNLEGVYVNVSRTIGGSTAVLGSGETGADGSITFWLNPDYPHNFVFSHPSYPLYETTITPTQSSYTVTLGGTTESNATNYQQGISYSVTPLLIELANGTDYEFNFTISTSYWSLDGFGFNITNEDGTNVGTVSSSSSSGGTVSLTLNTGLNESFYMVAYYSVENNTIEVSRAWLINTVDYDYSIANLVSRFSTYLAADGLFGLDSFGAGLIIFFTIIIIVGTVKMKRGITNDTVLVGLLFALVALFDVSLGLIPNPIGAVDHFPTIFMGIIFAGFMFKEVYK